MSSNQGTAGHEWGFVRGMASQPSSRSAEETASSPRSMKEPATPTAADTHRGSSETDRQVTVFAVDDHYLFAGQFTDDDLLEELRPFYSPRRGRFAVDQATFPRVERALAGAGYDVVVATDPGQFAVVVDETAPHPEAVLVDAVFGVSVGDQNVFVLPSEAAVADLTGEHVTPLADTPLRLSLSAAVDVGPVTVRDVATA